MVAEHDQHGEGDGQDKRHHRTPAMRAGISSTAWTVRQRPRGNHMTQAMNPHWAARMAKSSHTSRGNRVFVGSSLMAHRSPVNAILHRPAISPRRRSRSMVRHDPPHPLAARSRSPPSAPPWRSSSPEYFDDAKVFRPVDYMEYQTAGRATLNRENPYDGAVMYPLPTGDSGEAADDRGRAGRRDQVRRPDHDVEPAVDAAAHAAARGDALAGRATALDRRPAAERGGVRRCCCGGCSAGRRRRRRWPSAWPCCSPRRCSCCCSARSAGSCCWGWWGSCSCSPLAARRDGEGASESTPHRLGTGSLSIAGLLAALTAIKPHLLVPFAVVLLSKPSAAGGRGEPCSPAVLHARAVRADADDVEPGVWTQYREATAAQSAGTHNTPSEWMHPTLGYWLRTLHPDRPFAAHVRAAAGRGAAGGRRTGGCGGTRGTGRPNCRGWCW